MDFAKQVKDSVDITQVIGEYVRLKRMGSGSRYIGLCPFHTEKTPSFNVNGALGFYKCFGCGVGGDVLKFVMEIESLTFWEALKLLAEKNGIPVPQRSEYSDEDSRRRARMQELHDWAEKAFRENLAGGAGSEARAYLARRGVSADTASRFGIGLSGSGQQLVRLFERQGVPHEVMEESGLVLRRQDGSGYFDRFRGRLMFPIHSDTGKPVGFGGRALAAGDEPKYLNSPKTPLYEKERILYNLHRAKDGMRKRDRVVLVEGYMDVIGVHDAGVEEVVATCGTALTLAQIRLLKRFTTHIVMNRDPDMAGAKSADKSLETLLTEGMSVRVVQLPGALDPDEYVRERGAEAYRKAVDEAREFYDWYAAWAKASFDLTSPEVRVEVLRRMLQTVNLLPDKLRRLAVVDNMADILEVPKGMVLDEFKKAAAERRVDVRRKPETAGFHPNEQLLLRALLTNPEAREEILPVLKPMALVERFRTKGIFEAVFRLAETHPEFTFSDLEERLPDGEKALLAELIFADDQGGESVPFEQALGCLRALTESGRKLQKEEVKKQVKEAERAGNLEEALRLMRQLGELDHEV